MTTITEADVESAALDWLSALGWRVAHGSDIVPDAPGAERDDYGQAVLERRLRDALAELNPGLPASALDDAYRKLIRPEGSTLEARNRAFHRMLVDGVTVEHRDSVHAQEGRTLDVVTDLNGASKRALTLSLIWALMEVAEKEAPRIIDTPLGMTSGAVKHLMVELLTSPIEGTDLPYQVVLFMTRSEIRDIEQLIQDRAGVITTFTCSKDYPVDLVNDWGTSYPVVRTCSCDHTQVCQLCERRNDQGRFRYREVLD